MAGHGGRLSRDSICQGAVKAEYWLASLVFAVAAGRREMKKFEIPQKPLTFGARLLRRVLSISGVYGGRKGTKENFAELYANLHLGRGSIKGKFSKDVTLSLRQPPSLRRCVK
ncbi:MAG: hypothetical protein CVU57_16215 [Deltaproteobacteria bacterium HGW-Deltaproteobacteria-15]|jgi:hypothetical protein|nr:MAG: hypothetical protein CVU57_16215 [Deltaproteobacteria bacterium HGW-Deltaproteobacteria-15]